MYTITFKFEEKGLQPVALNNIAEGQSLLEVALTHDIELNHNCGGVCACIACHLYVENGEHFLEAVTEAEEYFIDRAINPRLNSRLGCQCILQPGGGDVIVTLPDQSLLEGA